MAAFVKFESLSEAVAEKLHDFNTDVVKAYLSNSAPSASVDLIKSDIAEISAGNGYTAGGVDTQNTTSRTGGVTSVIGVDFTITASGGTIGPFRYVILYNDTTGTDLLIGYWDYGSSITLADTEPFTTDFGSSMFTVS